MMSTTDRLYYKDSHLLEFDARVVELNNRDDGKVVVTLDRTAFYPTGGGQPNDTGTLGQARVIDCIEAENSVLHVIDGKAPREGDTLKGKVDWERRLDHIQQHTGQHILSQAFVSLFDAPTRGFRMMAEICEIDVALENPANDSIEQAVDLANKIIWEDRAMIIRNVTPEQAAKLPLRKEPSLAGELRLIEIVGFDLTPCGGTHAQRTGEVGLIAVRSWERAKRLTRIEFVAGGRALTDYRHANQTARNVAALFSAARDDAPALAARMLEENKELQRRMRGLEEIAARVEAEELLAAHASNSESGRARVITQTFNDRDAESLKRLALALVRHPGTIALLGARDKENARLVFARSADAAGDMNALMREACSTIDGRGGGKDDMAQGGGKNPAKVDEAINSAALKLSQA